MDAEELRRAATDLRKLVVSEWAEVKVKGPVYDWMIGVIDAYLAEHPADDGEPLHGPWWGSAGFISADGGWWLDDGNGTVLAFEYHDNTDDGDVYRLCGPFRNVLVSNRGQVRRLCAALGVSLTEGTE